MKASTRNNGCSQLRRDARGVFAFLVAAALCAAPAAAQSAPDEEALSAPDDEARSTPAPRDDEQSDVGDTTTRPADAPAENTPSPDVNAQPDRSPPPPLDDVPPVDEQQKADAQERSEAPEAPPARSPQEDDVFNDIDYGLLAGQIVAGVAASIIISVPLSLLSFIPVVGNVAFIIIPVLRYLFSGTVITFTGDVLGDQRGALAWPALASGVTGVVCNGLSALVIAGIALVGIAVFGVAAFTVLLGTVNTPTPDPTAVTAAITAALGAYLAAVLVAVGIGVPLIFASEVLAQSVGAVTSQLTADPKLPGDKGEIEWPGFFEPNHPGEFEDVSAPATPAPLRPMVY